MFSSVTPKKVLQRWVQTGSFEWEGFTAGINLNYVLIYWPSNFQDNDTQHKNTRPNNELNVTVSITTLGITTLSIKTFIITIN